MTHGCPRLKPSCFCTANAQRRWTQHVSLNMGAKLSETLQSHSIVFLYLFMSFSLHFSSLLNLFPCEGSVFFLSFGLTFFGTRGQRRSTLDGNKRRSSRPEISGDGNWQITRFSASQAAAPCTAYGCLLQAV